MKQTVSWPSLMITQFVLDSKTVKDVRELQMVLKEWRLDSQQQMKFNLAKFKETCTGRRV